MGLALCKLGYVSRSELVIDAVVAYTADVDYVLEHQSRWLPKWFRDIYVPIYVMLLGQSYMPKVLSFRPEQLREEDRQAMYYDDLSTLPVCILITYSLTSPRTIPTRVEKDGRCGIRSSQCVIWQTRLLRPPVCSWLPIANLTRLALIWLLFGTCRCLKRYFFVISKYLLIDASQTDNG